MRMWMIKILQVRRCMRRMPHLVLRRLVWFHLLFVKSLNKSFIDCKLSGLFNQSNFLTGLPNCAGQETWRDSEDIWWVQAHNKSCSQDRAIPHPSHWGTLCVTVWWAAVFETRSLSCLPPRHSRCTVMPSCNDQHPIWIFMSAIWHRFSTLTSYATGHSKGMRIPRWHIDLRCQEHLANLEQVLQWLESAGMINYYGKFLLQEKAYQVNWCKHTESSTCSYV